MPSNDYNLYQQRNHIFQYAHQNTASNPGLEQSDADKSTQTHFMQEAESEVDLVQEEAQAERELNSNSNEGQTEQQVQERSNFIHSAINLGEYDIQSGLQVDGRYEATGRGHWDLESSSSFNRGRSNYTGPCPHHEFLEDNERKIYSMHGRRERCNGTLWCLSPRDWPFHEDSYYEGVRGTRVAFHEKGHSHEHGSKSTWQYTEPHKACRWCVVRCNHDEDETYSGPLWCLPRANLLPDRLLDRTDCIRNINDYWWRRRRTEFHCGAGILKGHNYHHHPRINHGSRIDSNWQRQLNVCCNTEVGIGQSCRRRCFDLRGGHGENNEDIRPLPGYRHPKAEEDLNTLEENLRAEPKCRECDGFQNGLQPHLKKANARLHCLYARLRTARMEEEGKAEALFRLYLEDTRLVEMLRKANGAEECQRKPGRSDEDAQHTRSSEYSESNWRNESEESVKTLEQRICAERGYRTQEFKPRDVRLHEEEDHRKQAYELGIRRLSEIGEEPLTRMKTFVSKDRCIIVGQCCECKDVVATNRKEVTFRECLGCSHVKCSKCPSQLTHSTLRVEVDVEGKLV